MNPEKIKQLKENPFVENDSIAWEILSEKVKRKILLYDENVMMVCVAFAQGGVGALHRHPHVQTTLIKSGVFEVEIDGKKKVLKECDAFYIPSNALHGVQCLEDGELLDIFHPIREDFLN